MVYKKQLFFIKKLIYYLIIIINPKKISINMVLIDLYKKHLYYYLEYIHINTNTKKKRSKNK